MQIILGSLMLYISINVQTLLDAVGGQVITIRASYSFIQMLILAGPECIWTDHHFHVTCCSLGHSR